MFIGYCYHTFYVPVVEPGRTAWKKIKQEFGESVFHKSGEINREILGELIFEDVEKRRRLNEITHPEIYRELFWAAVRCFFQGRIYAMHITKKKKIVLHNLVKSP